VSVCRGVEEIAGETEGVAVGDCALSGVEVIATEIIQG